MSIKSQGGVFGRNPTFNDVTVEGDLSIAGTLSVGGETITGLSYQGGWNASTNTPDIAASSPVTGQFWIVSADGSTDVGGITNWTQGDWALYDGTNWQRVEGGNTDLSTGVQGQLAVANGGTGAADASTARTNLGLGTAATTASTDYATAAQGALADSALQSSDIGISVQGYDATILTSSDIGSTVQAYDAGTLTSADIGSTVQGYDADTTKNDVSNTFTAAQTFDKSTDGAITTYKIATNTVGSIGTAFTNDFYIKSNLRYLDFYTDGNTTGLTLRDDATAKYFKPFASRTGEFDLGASGSEFKNLYLSGNVVVASGSGIDFSATAGTGTSELLDDYEEGTWTPTLTTNGTDFSSVTYDGLRAGKYTKTGNTVYVSLTMRTDAVTVGSASGSVAIGGLPFTVNDNSSLAVGQCEQWAGEEPIAAYAQTSTTYIRLLYRSSVTGNTASTQVADVATGANGNEIQVSGFYFV